MAARPDNIPSVLILDDDDIILLAIRETLGPSRFDIHTCDTAAKALDLLRKRPFAVIISDQRMPEMTGLEFLNESKKIQPNASRILITGVLTLNTVIDAINKGEIFRFLGKPWVREELIATVQNAVQRYQLLEMNERLRADTLQLNDKLVAANAELQDKIAELSQRREDLERARKQSEANFAHSLDLCQRLLETYHPVLGRQTRATALICRRMAAGGLLDPALARTLEIAGRLHNIGMVGLPRHVCSTSLKDPRSLTEDETALLRHHPIYSQTLVSFFTGIPVLGETIRAHHERFDGLGYPDGLAGEDIPLPARCLAVAVAYVESMASSDDALETILQGSGNAFDPEAVRLFLKVTQGKNLPQKVSEITLAELAPGMRLAEGIFSPSGLLLIPEEQRLDESMVRKIREHDRATPITQRLVVYQD
ncbi:MAG: response regulator [Puniceicoccaceae bacterium]|nr:MAG: response regulator [Puniceicoccaceae bacterium]